MKYYTFLPRFHQAIHQGRKISTIRAKPKVAVGERFALRHWMGKPYRSRMGWLGAAVCSRVEPIEMRNVFGLTIIVGGQMLGLTEACTLAAGEGFANIYDMAQHFGIDQPGPAEVRGVLTTWKEFSDWVEE